MKKLILVNIAIIFAVGLFAQNDTVPVVQSKSLDSTFRKMPKDTMNQGLNMNNLKTDTLFDGKYSNKTSSHDSRMKRDTTPYDGKNNKVKMDTTMQKMDKMGKRDMDKMGKHDMDKMGKHDMDKMGKHDMDKMGKHDMDKMASQDMNNMKPFRGVMMKDGKVMIVRNGKMTIIKNYTLLNNGTKVMSDGTIVTTEGIKTMIKEGEYVNMAGNVVPIDDIRMKDRHQK
jgi:hypothetical protein